MPIHLRLGKINCCIAQKQVSEITEVIQEFMLKKCGIYKY
jgi:hypothetical protein